MNPNLTIFWTSEKNYMKRATYGSTNLAAPSVSEYSGYLKTTTYTVNHELGFIPLFRVYYQPFQDGIIWPAMGARLNRIIPNPTNLTGSFGPGLIAWPPDENNLSIQLFYEDNTLTGTFPVYWVIYQDYQL